MRGSQRERTPRPLASGPQASAGAHPSPVAPLRRLRIAVLLTAIVSVLFTVALAVLPQLHPAAYRWQGEDLALEMVASVTALLACFLVFGRLSRFGTLNELLLACALGILGLSNLLLVSVPIAAGWAPDNLIVWMAPLARSLGALLFAVAAFAPSRRLHRSGRVLAGGVAAVTTVMLLAAVLVHALARQLPEKALAAMASQSPARPDLDPNLPAVLELTVAVLYGVAMIGFLRRSRRLDNEFFGWLAVASELGAASHVNYLLYPAASPQAMYSGDLFRYASCAVLLVGSVREIASYWHGLSRAAVLEERQRIACDLHDGVTQELTYLAHNLDALSGPTDEDCLARLRGAVERAQLESRRTIRAVAAPAGQPFEIRLADAVCYIAERYHVRLDLDLSPDIQLSAPRREALVRIACEAVTNAARHSGTSQVALGLERAGSRARLRVRDEGRGFDTAAPGGGFGLTAMRERARSVGGDLRVTSTPGCGSQVELEVAV
jgi:signal transduction histidine kinase